MPEPSLEDTPAVGIRMLEAGDLGALVRMDQRYTGRSRKMYFERRVRRALAETDINVSLVAELDGRVVGAVLGTVQYGEYGLPEPLCVLDTLLVDRDLAGQGVGRALIAHLVRNLRALRIERVRTEVAWNEQALIGFLARAGFRPAPRLVLELALDGPP